MVELRFRVIDPLADPVAPVEPGITADLEGLAVGRCEDGIPYLLRLLQRHLLLVGATGAGKSGVVWSIIAQLLPAVLDRTAELWVLDPKGGMELGPGRALYAGFCRAEGDDWARQFAALLAEAVQVMRDRQNRLYAARERSFTPGAGMPLIVIVIDEIAALTAWVGDRNLQREMSGYLGLLLSQGRSAGVCAIAATQDPRKETLASVRDLTPTRILLRLTEASHVDLALGPGAPARGVPTRTRSPNPCRARPTSWSKVRPNRSGSGSPTPPTTTSPSFPAGSNPDAPPNTAACSQSETQHEHRRPGPARAAVLWDEPTLGESAYYRTARKAWTCTNQDRQPFRPASCVTVINPGDRYIDRHGSRYCLPCGIGTWQADD